MATNFFRDKLGINIPVRRTINSVFNREEEEKKKQAMTFRVGENITPRQNLVAQNTVNKVAANAPQSKTNFFMQFLGEVPAAKQRVGQNIKTFAKDVAQGTARNTASLGISLYNRQARKFGVPEQETIPVDNFFSKMLYGNEAPRSIEARARENQARFQEVGQRRNIPILKTKAGSTALGFAMPVLSIASDLFSGGGKKGLQQTASFLAKSKDLNTVQKTLREIGYGEDLVTKLAPKFTKITNSADVLKLLNQTPVQMGRVADISKTFKNSIENNPTITKPGALERATEEIKKGIKPPVKVRTLEDGSLFIEDGRHHLEAARRAGLTDYPIDDITHKYGGPVVKERGFLTSMKESPKVSTATKEAIDNLDNRTYEVATDVAAMARAQKRVADNEAEALSYVMKSDKPDKDVITTGIELMRKYRLAGNTAAETEVAAKLAEDLTKAGQAVQAASILGKLSPDGVLIYAQRQIQKANKKRLLPGIRKAKELTTTDAEKLKSLAQQAEEATDPIVKAEAQAEIVGLLNALTRSGIGRKIATTQTVAQLLSPKTMARNTLGNEIFWRLERINKYIATPIDMARSAITGKKRTITFRTGEGLWDSFLRANRDYIGGFKSGAKAGFKGSAVLPTQVDLPHGLTFTSKHNPMTWFEKTMRAGLQGFDYAAYNRAHNTTIKELAWLKAINEGKKGADRVAAAKKYAQEVDDKVMEIADQYGKYVTYQDDNVISKGLTKFKKVLNLGKDFGLGDIIIKYPKTPGAILMRGLEYSPVGVLKALYELSQPILKEGGKIDNAAVTNALSRSITGSLGLTALGYFLADKGIISGRAEEDFDVQATQKESGVGKYQVNMSALKRFVTSGFKETEQQAGDLLYSYDWAQPVALMLSIGANSNANKDKGQGVFSGQGLQDTAIESVTGGVQTLSEQPVLQGLGRLVSNPRGWRGIGEDIIKQTPATFAPTALNQTNQFFDNKVRSTYDPNILKESWNRVAAKVPGLAQTLPSKRTIFGEEEQRFQDGSNNFVNVFLNPGFLKRYKEDPAVKMVMDIYGASGETKQAPRVVPTSQSITIDGKSTTRKITAKEQEALQLVVGKITRKVFDKIASGDQAESFKREPPEKQAKILAEILSDINQVAKIQILGHRPDPRGVSERARAYSRQLKNDPEFTDYLFTRTP